MPMQTFLDFALRRTVTSESGFIATTEQLTCLCMGQRQRLVLLDVAPIGV